MYISSFGERLNLLISANDISIAQLGNALNINPCLIRHWLKPDTDKLLSTALKLADYFYCSLDYLCGRSEDYSHFNPHRLPPLVDRIRLVINEYKISSYQLFKQTRIQSSYFQRWKSGSDPKISSLCTIADFIDCSLDYLIGRE